MATVRAEGKSGFLKEFFVDYPEAGKAAVNEAWQGAGNAGTISQSLIHRVRTQLGLNAKRRSKAQAPVRARSGKHSAAAPPAPAQSTRRKVSGRTLPKASAADVPKNVEPPARPTANGRERTRTLIALESEIDDLLHRARAVAKLPEFEEAVRKARRILARAHLD